MTDKPFIDKKKYHHILASRRKWFTSEHINMAMYYMANKFEHIDGFFDSEIISCVRRNSSIEYPTSKFVQIINVKKSHWITISNLRCSDSHIDVYDSMRSSYQDRDKFLMWYLGRSFCTKSLTLLQHDVQQQSNAYDCGPYAIAFALTLCLGIDPSMCSYDEEGLRSGIRQIFASEELIPLQSGHRRSGLPRTIDVEIYCICQVAYQGDGTANMVDCDMCGRWYHDDCVQAPKSSLRQTWHCHDCISNNIIL